MTAQEPTWRVSLDSQDSFPAALAKLLKSPLSDDVEPDAKRRRVSGGQLGSVEDLFPILLRRIQAHISFSTTSGSKAHVNASGSSVTVPLIIGDIKSDAERFPSRFRPFPRMHRFGSESGSKSEESDLSPSGSGSNSYTFYYSNGEDPETFSVCSSDKSEDKDSIMAIFKAAILYQKTSAKKLCKTSFTITHVSATYCVIQLDVRWRDSQFFSDISSDNKQYDFLRMLSPDLNPVVSSAWSPRDFYNSVYIPDKEDKTSEDLDLFEIRSTLFGYQKRTVQWMLKREGVDIHGKSLAKDSQSILGHGWLPAQTADDQPVFINQWLGLVTTHESLMHGPYTEVSGGILAEEMGLGKTVEIIALLLRNRRDSETLEHEAKGGLLSANATLIIAPDSIINQWASEINLHAPSLRTLLYPGLRSGGKQKEKELLNLIQESHIVLCSYNTLAREVHFARDIPDRNTRHKRAIQHERIRSPLVQFHWWRCVLDECQMIQSGVSNAAEVALQIPRQHAWAVSGTPLRKDPGDVYGLLQFLQLLPYSWSARTWTRLLDQYQSTFQDLIKQIVLRHTKHLVKDEIELPPQKRIVSSVSFTQIEEQHYSNTFDRMCQRVGLDRDGAPLRDIWNPNDPATIEQMRIWLTRLRQLCLHPDVGARNNKALGGRVQDVLRTVTDVLQVMTEQNEVTLRADERSFFMVRLRRGQLFESDHNPENALGVWQEVLPQIRESIGNIRNDIEKTVLEVKDEEEESSSVKLAHNNRLKQLRTRLRLGLELEHIAGFSIGNAYFQMKDDKDVTEPDSEEFQRLERLEVSQYDVAKAIRLELLTEPSEAVQKLIPLIDRQSRWRPVDIEAAQKGFPRVEDFGGIESNGILNDLDKLAKQYNKLMKQILAWRSRLVELLSKPLVDYAADDVHGDEYEISTKEQDETYTRMDIYRAAVEDLSEILTGEENALIKNEANSWAKLAQENKGHAPELMLELLQTRDYLRPVQKFGSVRGHLARLKATKNNFRQGDARDKRRKLEADILEPIESEFRKALSSHDSINKCLHEDVSSFIDIQNGRLEFYRQLQHISDLVAPWPQLEEDDETNKAKTRELTDEEREVKMRKKIEECRKKLDIEEAQLQANIKKKSSQARYLEHLKNASTLGDERKCIICQDEKYEIGVLTGCGHLFCKDCINAWLTSHAKCPQCRATIKSRSELYQITYKPQELRMEEEEVSSESSDTTDIDGEKSPKLTSIYSQITTQQLNEIKSIDLPHAFGTKIDFLARHIIWLRGKDSKTVVFSQFRGFCPERLSQAFDRIGIRYAIVGGKIGVDRFKYDPSVECLLMHAGSQASGMNLVNASHVLLCEPLVNTALEAQAIARVHRIGQHRPTTVWMYLIEGTIEKAIYDLSVERRLEHIGNQKKEEKHKRSGISTPIGTDEDIQAVDAEEMNDKPLTTLLSKNNESGEIVGKDDLWQCLFGNSQPRRGLPDMEIGE